MANNAGVIVSDNFQKMAVKAIWSIFLFMFTYVLMIFFALGLTALCGYLALELIATYPSFFALVVGIGIISVGVLILIFLVKFVSKKHSVDRSNMVEVTLEQEPELFKIIKEVVDGVKTDFPKKVYLSADVNASVFYDSSFWSMVLPVKKNLQIGLGLVNTITLVEFKAILAHEFGHFSQKSMKVGSFVYNFNQIIYNILYDNKSYEEMIDRWASFSIYFSFFILPVIKVIQGIQWVLKKLYEIINISYMGLSREMEFHADEIAANVTGSKALETSLLRIELADYSYNYLLSYYQNKIEESVKSKNIYQQHKFVMDFFAKERGLDFKFGLPQVNLEYIKRYNKSKLIVKDQWASHPTMEERVRALQNIGIEKEVDSGEIALSVFNDPMAAQIKLTEHLFSFVEYKKDVSYINDEEFNAEFTAKQNEYTFDKAFNGYYDNKNPKRFTEEDLLRIDSNLEIDPSQFYNDSVIEWLLRVDALENDINGLKFIEDKKNSINAFDYDGIKYGRKDCSILIAEAEKELNLLNEKLNNNDLLIYKFCLNKSKEDGKGSEFIKYHEILAHAEKEFQSRFDTYKDIVEVTAIVHEVSSFDSIERSMIKLRKLEKQFKENIEALLKTPDFGEHISEQMKNNFKAYLSIDWNYFSRPSYDDDALKILFTSINDYQIIASKPIIKAKRELLAFQSVIYRSSILIEGK